MTRWVLTIKVPFHNDQGKIIGLVGMNRDITRLKETEVALRHAHDEVEMRVLRRTADLVKANQALSESEQRYKQLLNSVTDYIYTVQVENNQVVRTIHSPNCIAVTGYSQQEYETNPHLWYQMIHVEDRPAVVEQVNALLTKGSAEPLEHRLWHKNGSIRWVRNTAVLRKDEYGSILSYEGLLSDITARKEAEEALRQSESKYRLLLEHASDGIMILDQKGQILEVNSKTCDLLHYPRAELVGVHFSDFIPATDLANVPLGFEELLAGKTLLRERFLRRHDYSLVPVEISSKMIEPNRILAILRDISERKAVERRENLAHQIGRQLTTLLDPAALLAETANRLKETFGYYHVHIYLCQQVGREQDAEPCLLVIHEGTGEVGAALKAQRFTIAIDAPQSLVAQAARTLQPVVANDVDQDPAFLPNPFLTQTRSEAAFPLFLGQRLIGVLDVQHSQVDHFNIHEVRTLQIIASQLSVALANAQLFAEQERLLEEVRAGRERLQLLSHRLVEVQEAERRHIARELHDAVGQLLTGLKLTLEMSVELPNDEIRSSLAEPLALVNELITRVRELSLELRPAMLDDLGLLPTLSWHFERYMAQTKLDVRLKHAGVEGQRFDPATETAAYRIIQEALTNVARYADPARVTVQLWVEQQHLCVQIADDGGGFDLAAVQAAGRTSGLSGMAERAALLGGELSIASEPGAGTRVTARLPLTRSEKESQ
jgi:PAS domain S-box-containing protein